MTLSQTLKEVLQQYNSLTEYKNMLQCPYEYIEAGPKEL